MGGNPPWRIVKHIDGQDDTRLMNKRLHFFIDDQGLSRSIRDMWAPSLDIDVIWTTSTAPPDEIILSDQSTPTLELSPADIAALSIELSAGEGQILVIFHGLHPLIDAVDFGLNIDEVVIVRHHSDAGERIAPDVYFSENELQQIQQLRLQGIQFVIQPIPNVTARPWDGINHMTALSS